MWPLILVELTFGALLRRLGRLGDACWLALAVLAVIVWLVLAGLYTLGVVVVGNALLAGAWVRRQVRA